MRILFLHQNFPGQFRHLARHLAAEGDHQLVALGQDCAPGMPELPALKFIRYQPKREPGAKTHRYLHGMERAVLVGQAVANVLTQLRQEGFSPDVVVAHPGWGESLYVKDVYPDARLIHFCEYYYHPDGADAGFDPAEPLTLDDRARIRTRNALHLLNLQHCDVAVAPTHWQKSLHPAAYHDKIHVIHEGINVDAARPKLDAQFVLANGRVLSRQQKIVTYVARNLEPYRGFPQFMRGVSLLLQQCADVEVLVVGGDGVSYGGKPKDAVNWREKLCRELPLDSKRVHFLGKLPYAQYLQVLQVSSVHVYLTYPFVLSWSLLEAMAAGCLVLASDTAPLHEVIRDGDNGLLTNFFDSTALAGRLQTLLSGQIDTEPLRQRARATVLAAYSHGRGNAAWAGLLALQLHQSPLLIQKTVAHGNGKTNPSLP